MVDYEPEVWTSYMTIGDRKLYFSGRRIQTKGGTEYAAIQTKDGRISRGVDRAYVEEFSKRSQPAMAVERAFQEAIENGNLQAEIMDREINDG